MMGTLRNIYHLGVKELRSLGRDSLMTILILYAFTGAVYIRATSVPGTLHKAPIAIVDEDRSPLSGRLVDAFYPPHFLTPALIAPSAIDPGLDRGVFTFAIDIPPDFQRDLLAGRAPVVQLNVDATRMSQAFIGNTYIQNIIHGEIDEFLRGDRTVEPLPVELTLRTRFNPNLSAVWFGSVMELINSITMLSIILTGAAIIREREHGTLEHLLVMPLSPFEIMLAKVWSMALVVATVALVSLLVVVQGWLGVPIEGSIPLFAAGMALNLFATTSMGIFLGTVARSMPQMGLLMVITLLPLEMLSGGATPYESMPAFVQQLMQVAPTTHFVALAQGILYRGAGFAIVWPQFLALLGIGVFFFVLALARFRRTLSFMT